MVCVAHTGKVREMPEVILSAVSAVTGISARFKYEVTCRVPCVDITRISINFAKVQPELMHLQ